MRLPRHGTALQLNSIPALPASLRCLAPCAPRLTGQPRAKVVVCVKGACARSSRFSTCANTRVAG